MNISHEEYKPFTKSSMNEIEYNSQQKACNANNYVGNSKEWIFPS